MPRKKPQKPEPAASQSIQLVKRQDEIVRLPNRRRITILMNAFVRAFERNCGNISGACAEVGITRRTYYRWASGTTPECRRFQKKVFRVYPRERLKDAAHSVVVHHLTQNNLTAAMFTLNNLKEDDQSGAVKDLLERVANAMQDFISKHPDATIEDKVRWLAKFAEKGRVEPAELAKRVGIEVPR